MSNRNKTMKKNKKTAEKRICFLTAIALSAALLGSQFPIETGTVYAAETQNDTPGSVIPDNITIDEPMALSDIGLPGSTYGTLEWADGSYVPNKRVQSCPVILIPAEGVDLSHVSGWDAETGTVTGSINVIVSSISGSRDDNKEDADRENTETEENVTPSGEDKENTDSLQNPDTDITLTPVPSVTGNTEQKDQSALLVPSEKPSDEQMDDETAKTDQEEDSENEDSAENIKEDKKEEGNLADGINTADPSDDTEQKTDQNQEDDSDQTDDTENSDGSGEGDNGEKDDNIFDNPISPDEKDDRPSDADDSLSDEEKENRAEMNHTCDGITVSGINLPWYVQFRVSSGGSYQFTNESDAMIFQSYEFELWDLQNNTEYEIPSGEYISVTVPVKAGYDYTIEHLLDNGATETIIPSVDGDTMVFSTHSFSPFGIAGSKQLVGPDAGEDTDDSTTSVTATPAPTESAQITPASENQSVDMNTSDNNGGIDSNNNSNNSNNDNTNNDGNSGTELQSAAGNSSAQADSTAENSNTSNNSKAVKTGDNTTILPFVVLFLAAAVIAGAVVFIKRKKK